MDNLKGKYWKVCLLNGAACWKSEDVGKMSSPKKMAFLWFSQHQQAWFFSNKPMDENLVQEETYWKVWNQLEVYATCRADHKDTEIYPGEVFAPHDSNMTVPFKVWSYLHWLEATNISWSQDYNNMEKKLRDLEAHKGAQPSGSSTQSPAFAKKQASFMMKMVALITAYKMEDWARAEYLISRPWLQKTCHASHRLNTNMSAPSSVMTHLHHQQHHD